MKLNRRVVVKTLALLPLVGQFPAVLAEPKEFDVAVVGGGISGCVAALEAAEEGKKVVLIQAQPLLGGDAYLSTGWMYAYNSPLQRKNADVEDSEERFVNESLEISNGKRDPMWVKIVAKNAGKDIEWLEKNGVTYEDFVEAGMGSSVPRAIQVKGYGRALITALGEAIRKTGNAEILLNTRCTGLIVKDGKLLGVTVQTKDKSEDILAKSVILATGGFPFNKEMIKKYAPQFAEMGAVGDPNLQGDGIRYALEVGAQGRNLDIVNIVPTTDVETKIYLTSGALSGGGILINEKGERFTNELKNYTATSLAMLDQKHVYEILVPQTHSKVQVLVDKGMLKKADSIEALAKDLDVPYPALAKEIEQHNLATQGKAKDRFGRVIYKEELKPPFYYMEVMPQILQTFGGVVTNDKAQILDQQNKVIFPNLFAAGDVISGYLDGGYRTGDALMFGTVSGRIAGNNAG